MSDPGFFERGSLGCKYQLDIHIYTLLSKMHNVKYAYSLVLGFLDADWAAHIWAASSFDVQFGVDLVIFVTKVSVSSHCSYA